MNGGVTLWRVGECGGSEYRVNLAHSPFNSTFDYIIIMYEPSNE